VTIEVLHRPGILILRADEQATQTIEQVRQQGWNPIHFPTIKILPANGQINKDLLNRLATYNRIIFISQNAVRHFILQLEHLPEKLPPVATIGKATRIAAVNAGLPVAPQPDNDFDSESLLARPEFQQVAGQEILIVRGNGGRELLADTLTQRGAKVTYAEVYERRMIDTDPGELIRSWGPDIDIILATSVQLLENLVTLLAGSIDRQLYNTAVVVISDRMQQQAANMGFSKIWLADGPTNDQMIATVKKILTVN